MGPNWAICTKSALELGKKIQPSLHPYVHMTHFHYITSPLKAMPNLELNSKM